MVYYAHKTDDGRYQTMKEHAEGVAELAGKFASMFDLSEYGKIIGLHHDDGKYSQAFQERLNGGNIKYEHSSACAFLLAKKGLKQRDPVYMMLAHTIAGHHSGLPDTGTKNSGEDDNTFFAKYNRREKMQFDFSGYEPELGEIPEHSPLPYQFKNNYSMQFLGRMLFSALVDADFS